MANQKDVLWALEQMHQCRPNNAFEPVKQSEMGLFAVLRYLYEAQENGKAGVTSKEISDTLHVSSARMTVVLKKLAQKGWIEKTNSTQDARAVVISLSETGLAQAEQLKKQMYHTMEKIVDEFGVAELQRLFESLQKIKEILYECRPNQLEETDA